MSLGDTLRRAREEKKLTTSQVAETTRMLSQVVEDLEREDYRRHFDCFRTGSNNT